MIPAILSKIYKTEKISILYYKRYPDPGRFFADRLKHFGMDTQLLPQAIGDDNRVHEIEGIVSSQTGVIYSMLGKVYSESLINSDTLRDIRLEFVYFNPEDYSLKQSARHVVERLRSKRVEPNEDTLAAYAALQVWSQAVGRVHSLKAESVSQVLKTDRFDTILGKLRFDKKGDISPLLSGTVRSCGTRCPSSCKNNCYERNGNACCDLASMRRPEI